MKATITLILLSISLSAISQTTDSLEYKQDSISIAIEKQKQELEKLKMEREKLEQAKLAKLKVEKDSIERKKAELEKVKLEKEKVEQERIQKELERKSVLSDKSISLDRAELQKDIDQIVKPVFTPGKVEVMQSSINTSSGPKEAIQLSIPEVNIDKVRKDWYKTMKKSSKNDVNEKGNSYAVNGASIKKVSNEPIDMEVNFTDNQGTILMSAVFLKDSTVVNSSNYPQIYASAEGYLRRYGLETYQSKVKSDIKEEEKNLKNLKKELERMIKKNEKEHKKISDNKLLIDAAEDELKLNDSERERALVNIQNKRERVRQVSGKDAIKEAKRDVKEAQNEKKSLEKSRKKTYRGIVEYKSDIERANQAIDLNLQRQKEQTLTIYKQELKVKALEEKLAAIK